MKNLIKNFQIKDQFSLKFSSKKLLGTVLTLTIIGVSFAFLPLKACAAGTSLSDRFWSLIGNPTLKPNEPAIPEATEPSPASVCEEAANMTSQFVSNEVVLPTKLKIDSILISKSGKKLWIKSDGDFIRAYDIALGFNLKGHKFREGDGRTPEGRYYISRKKTSGEYYPSLQISYPNRKDSQRSKEVGYDAGGDILIHGLPKDPNKYSFVSNIHPYVNWTQGCVAVNDTEIEEIFSLVPEKTIVDICP